MLVLTRKKDESIIIGDDIEIRIIDIDGKKIRVGICAPKETPVHRKEIYDQILEQKTQDARENQRKDL